MSSACNLQRFLVRADILSETKKRSKCNNKSCESSNHSYDRYCCSRKPPHGSLEGRGGITARVLCLRLIANLVN